MYDDIADQANRLDDIAKRLSYFAQFKRFANFLYQLAYYQRNAREKVYPSHEVEWLIIHMNLLYFTLESLPEAFIEPGLYDSLIRPALKSFDKLSRTEDLQQLPEYVADLKYVRDVFFDRDINPPPLRTPHRSRLFGHVKLLEKSDSNLKNHL